MVSTGALIHGDQARHLDFNPEEHKIALQLGGSDPGQLAYCARIAEKWGYDEVNLNCGCPSPRVQKGSFGACLMAEPALVSDCVKAMIDKVDIPITVKHRVGIDRIEDYGFVRDFVGTLFDVGVRVFIVHARNAWLKGLSPKENREVPPLKREFVFKLKEDFPEATVVINGAINDLTEAECLLKKVDGVMLGRAAYYTPWLLSDVDARLFDDNHDPITREIVIEQMADYVRRTDPEDIALRATCRHMHGLLTGLAGAKTWRRILSDAHVIRQLRDEVFEYAYAQAGWRDLPEDGVFGFS